MDEIKEMMWYRAKDPKKYPRYDHWQLIGTSEWGAEDFQRFEVQIDKTVYTENTEEFRKHLEQNAMWDKLKQ